MTDTINPGSFRDPDGFLFYRDNTLYRQVNHTCKQDYDRLMESGLYGALVKGNLLVPHQETDIPFSDPEKGYKIIQPELVHFISYPYEWCFSQLKDAALATLKIQAIAFEHGMSLKDASVYNIQFKEGRPVFIDTLSFEVYRENEPWIAYRQFCQHFLAPLALMCRTDVRLNQLLRIYLDGIPLDMARTLLPSSSRFSPSLYMHIFLHGKEQKKYEDKAPANKTAKISKFQFKAIINSLESAVRKLKWTPRGTEWGDYYNDTNYTPAGQKHKKELVSKFIDTAAPAEVWDVGANNGLYSRIAAEKSIPTTAFDIDPAAVEQNYLMVKEKKETHMLPLVMDLTNPNPGIGWENRERHSFMDRGPAGLVVALALIHHLAISNNVPLPKTAAFFHALAGPFLVIEFVPKEDSQVQRLLATREDVFPGYRKEDFEKAYSQYFDIREAVDIEDSLRTLYLMEKKPISQE